MADQMAWLKSVLSENEGKNFVRRILEPSKYPYMDLGEGNVASHKMAVEVDEDTGRWIAFPTIMQDGDALTDYGATLGVRGAMQEAMRRGEYIDFGGDKEGAIWFGRNYKKVWK